ncbi:MAG: helix-turn-helix transcriptional regulator [Candidatus Bathyarchaeia archaeon]
MCMSHPSKTLIPSAILIIYLIIFNICCAATEAYKVAGAEITVYSDGLTHLRFFLQVNSTTPSISFPIPKDVGNIIVTDEGGRLIQYDQKEGSLLIYTLGEEDVILECDTTSLTFKEGSVWTLKLNMSVQVTVMLPEEATVIFLSGLPNSIEARGSRPVLKLPQGVWEISYVMPLPASLSGPSTFTSPPVAVTPLTFAASISMGVLALSLALLYFRRRASRPIEGLSPIDSQILGFIRSRGGRVFEYELRDELGLPKTSAWRRVRRLHRMGYVRRRKVGSQNEVELI